MDDYIIVHYSHEDTFIIDFISGSLPITGSNFPASASAVRSLQYKFNELDVSFRLKDSCCGENSSLLIEVERSGLEFLEVVSADK